MSVQTAPFRFAGRTRWLAASAIGEQVKRMNRPGLVKLGAGMPSPDAFPIDALREATQRVLAGNHREALQYSTAAGLPVLREWVAERLRALGMAVQASQVLITSGSQQGLDLVGKLLLEAQVVRRALETGEGSTRCG